MAGSNVDQFSKTYWEKRLKEIDCKDIYAALIIVKEAYDLGREEQGEITDDSPIE